jgi:hypothetical protein
MSRRTSLVKIVFVVSILGVLVLAAVAPSIARAYFSQGIGGFTDRLFGRQEAVEAAVKATNVESIALPSLDDSSSAVDDQSQAAAPALDSIEFVGTLTAKDGNVWMVESVTVYVSPATELKGVLEVGDLVKVEGALQADGSVQAREIKPALFDDNGNSNDDNSGDDNSKDDSAPAGNEIEFYGTVTEQMDTQWLVSGITVLLSDATEIYGAPVVDDLVKVEGALQADGSVLVREIKPALFDGSDDANSNDDRPSGEFEFTGVLQAKNGNTWVVNGITVIITAQTELKGTLQIGEMVKVHGMRQQDASVVAREIENAEGDDSNQDDSGNDDSSDDNSDDDNSNDDDDDDDDDDGDDDDSGHGGGGDDDDDDDSDGGDD